VVCQLSTDLSKMDWKSTGIGAAIQLAKSSNKLFVVFVHEDCQSSKAFLELLNSQKVAQEFNSNCVSIKVGYNDEARKQFEQFYPILIVPSIYFIESTTGVNLEVTAGEADQDKLLASLRKANEARSSSVPGEKPAAAASAHPAAAPTPPVESTSAPLESAVASDNSQSSSSADKAALEERVARAKELLEKRRQQKMAEEEDKVKNSEMERRTEGKNLQEFKRQQEEMEAKRNAEERKKDKAEEAAAKERVRAQIAQDRAEKAAKFNQLQQEEDEKRKQKELEKQQQAAAEAERLVAARSTTARVQFRLPDGRSQTKSFEADAPLSDVYAFVSDELETGFGRSFSLSTTYPRRQLDTEDMTSQLRDIGLAPSGTIMVLPSMALSSSSSGSGSVIEMLWFLLTPLTFLWSIIQSFFTTAAPSASGTRPERSTGTNQRGGDNRVTNRREGNIGRIRNADDDDEDNNTYNGNSTQQM